MSISIQCRELGEDCPFVADGETEEVVMDLILRHVHAEHGMDWFETEELYQAACTLLRKKAA